MSETITEQKNIETIEEDNKIGSLSEPEVRKIIEALLLVSSNPLSVSDINKIIENTNWQTIKKVVYNLKEYYDNSERGFMLMEIGGGFQLMSRPEYAEYIRKLLKPPKQKFSKAALETISIIAYKQPITRAEIEAIRGVQVGGILRKMIDLEIIKVSGKADTIGRPPLYVTTNEFLNYFGLKSLKDLPELQEFE